MHVPFRLSVKILFLCFVILASSGTRGFSQGSQPPSPEPVSPAEPSEPESPQKALILQRIEGAVRILEPGSPFPKPPGTLPRVLKTGEKIQTTRAAKALILSPYGEVLLDGDSLLTVLAPDATKLESGLALFEITTRDGRRITAQTPLVVIGVKGTRFMVSSTGKREDISLFKGNVGVQRQDGQAMAHFEAKSPKDMSFSEYAAFEKKTFGDYQTAMMQDFMDYKKIMAAEFKAFKEEIDLRPGRRLTMGGGEKTEAVEADLDKASQEAAQSLQRWKNQP